MRVGRENYQSGVLLRSALAKDGPQVRSELSSRKQNIIFLMFIGSTGMHCIT